MSIFQDVMSLDRKISGVENDRGQRWKARRRVWKGQGWKAERRYPEPKSLKKKLDSTEESKGAEVSSGSVSIKKPPWGSKFNEQRWRFEEEEEVSGAAVLRLA